MIEYVPPLPPPLPPPETSPIVPTELVPPPPPPPQPTIATEVSAIVHIAVRSDFLNIQGSVSFLQLILIYIIFNHFSIIELN
jgi:hypothetical protein